MVVLLLFIIIYSNRVSDFYFFVIIYMESIFMKENYEKLKYLIAGSEIESDHERYKSYKFVVPMVMEIYYTIYNMGEDFIYIHGDYFTSSYWFDELKIEDDEYGCKLYFNDRGSFIGSVGLKNIYLEGKQ